MMHIRSVAHREMIQTARMQERERGEQYKYTEERREREERGEERRERKRR